MLKQSTGMWMSLSDCGHWEGFKVIPGVIAVGIWSSVGGPPVALLIVDAPAAVESSNVSIAVDMSVWSLPSSAIACRFFLP